MKQLEQTEQMTLLKIKSLLNSIDYFIKDEHRGVIDNFHVLCRKYCSFGNVRD